MGQGLFRGLGALGGRCVQSPPKNSARKLGGQRPRERQDGCAIAFVGRGGCGLRGTQNEANLSEDPQAARGEVCAEARQQIVPAGQGVKGPAGPETGVL